jgi:sigma-B regulation protein RsbQ
LVLGAFACKTPVIMGNPERPELGEELANSFCRTDPRIARAFARTTFLSDNRASLAPAAAAAAVTAVTALLGELGDGVQDDAALLALGVPSPAASS